MLFRQSALLRVYFRTSVHILRRCHVCCQSRGTRGWCGGYSCGIYRRRQSTQGRQGVCIHLVEVIPGGLEGVRVALTNLMEGKASAVKYAVKVKNV
jgi:hypothetical protein